VPADHVLDILCYAGEDGHLEGERVELLAREQVYQESADVG